MRRTKVLLVLGLIASAAALPVSTAARPQAGNGIEPVASGAWPAVAAQLAKNIARASFAHDYGRVWSYLHPSYRQAVSQAQWNRCQGAHPAAPRNVTITSVAVASAAQLPVRLSLLGRQMVQEIQLSVRFKTPAIPALQIAVLYTFWLKQGTTWRAVWLSDEFQAYKAGKCYLTPQGPPLY
jgi:hypothetical protein